MPLEIKKYRGKTLSCFRTLNSAKYYADIRSENEAAEAFEFAERNGLSPFVLGGGSNVFFKNSDIKAFVLKNALEKKIEYIGSDRFLVSSSVRMMDFLKRAFAERRDACYYLASAPCEIGGALAMNAGSGPRDGRAIFDFVESVRFMRGGKVFEKSARDISHSYRKTELSDGAFIFSAVFKLPGAEFNSDPIKDRIDWAKEHQDLSAPNCGSLCNKYDADLMKFARALFRIFPAGLSQKKLNWAYNKADNPTYLRAFLSVLSILHKLFKKELKFEIKIVE